MKIFLRTVPGKTMLFIAFSLCVCIIFACIIGTAYILNQNLYETSEDEYLENMQRDIVYSHAYNFAMSRLIYDEDYDMGSNAGIIIYDENGKTVASSSNAGLMKGNENYKEYKFSIGVEKEGDKVTSIYRRKPINQDAFYSIRVYVDKNTPINESFALVSTLVHLAFSLRYAVYPIGFAALLACVVIFITLMCVSGRQPDSDELHPGPFFKVPYDLLLAVTLIMGAILTLFVASLDDIYKFIGLAIVALAGINAALGLSMSFAVRIKHKTLIHNTVIYKCLCLIRNILRWTWKCIKGFFKWFRDIIHNIPMVWRTAVILLGISFIEFVVILSCRWDFDKLVILWFVEKLIVLPAVLFAAVTMRRLQKAGIALADVVSQHR